jgi:hypothetical protein
MKSHRNHFHILLFIKCSLRENDTIP